MLTPKQLKHLGTYLTNPFKGYTFREFKELSNEKSNSILQRAISQFLKEKLITEKEVGRTKVYHLNMANDMLFHYLSLVAESKILPQINQSLQILKWEIEKYSFFYAMAIFGSYANATFKKDSDIDVAIFIPDQNLRKNIEIAAHAAQNKSLVHLDIHIITSHEFIEMLSADYENLGKEIARKHFPVHNLRIFYKLIEGGIQRGFKIVS